MYVVKLSEDLYVGSWKNNPPTYADRIYAKRYRRWAEANHVKNCYRDHHSCPDASVVHIED